MVRVLLLLEDYNELLFTETILKKVGFDVESAKNHLNLVETLLGFNPEVLVVPAVGRRIQLAEVLQQVRKQRRQPEIFVIGHNEDLVQENSVAKILSQPLNPKELLTSLAEYGDLDADILLDKYKRAQAEARETVQLQSSAAIDQELFKAKQNSSGQEAENSPSEKKGLKIQLQPTTLSPTQREERFKKALSDAQPIKKTFDKEQVKTEKKALRMNETQDERSIQLENERKEFLKTLTEVTPTSSSKKTN